MLESGIDSGLTQAQIDEIINTPKGSRPDPSSYLSKEYIDAHLAQFDDGVSVIQTDWAYSRYSETNGFVGVPDDNNKKYEVVISEFTSDVFPTDINSVLVNCFYKQIDKIKDIEKNLIML